MQRKRSFLLFMMATVVLSFCVTPVMAVTNVTSVWTSPQTDCTFSRDYYEVVSNTGLPDPNYNRHIGRIDVNYKVKYISNDDPSYDYYSIAIRQEVRPAIAMTGEGDPATAFVTEAKCHGCGTCASGCPSHAIVMRHSTSEQIMTMVEAFLQPAPLEGGE